MTAFADLLSRAERQLLEDRKRELAELDRLMRQPGGLAGFPVFAIRYPHPLPNYSPNLQVQVWHAGGLKPVFEGRHEDATRFEIRHDCPVRDNPTERIRPHDRVLATAPDPIG